MTTNTTIKNKKAGFLFNNNIDPKLSVLNKQLKIAFSEIKRDMSLHEEQIFNLKEEIKELNKELKKLKEEKITTTPLMQEILKLPKDKNYTSKDIFQELNKQGITIHEKSIPRAIKSLYKIGKIKKTKRGKTYFYSIKE